MALNISVAEGGRVYIGDRLIRVTEIRSLTRATIVDDTGMHHDLFDNRSTEVYPGVFVSIGRKQHVGQCSLTFEAPKSVVILREELYRRGKEESTCVSS